MTVASIAPEPLLKTTTTAMTPITQVIERVLMRDTPTDHEVESACKEFKAIAPFAVPDGKLEKLISSLSNEDEFPSDSLASQALREYEQAVIQRYLVTTGKSFKPPRKAKEADHKPKRPRGRPRLDKDMKNLHFRVETKRLEAWKEVSRKLGFNSVSAMVRHAMNGLVESGLVISEDELHEERQHHEDVMTGASVRITIGELKSWEDYCQQYGNRIVAAIIRIAAERLTRPFGDM
jgi:hypothetical protein